MVLLKLLSLGVLAAVAYAQTALYPIEDVRAGLRGTGRTVFAGDSIDEFQVEILGVLENAGPKQSIILGRLSGGPLEKTGVMQGMSGSPVYVDGKLLGAVALAFPLTTEPLAGIRPIDEMLRTSRAEPTRRVALTDRDLVHVFEKRHEVFAGNSRLVEIATPVSFGGFTRNTVEQFAPQLRRIGLEPMQGLSGGRPNPELGEPSRLKPGSMISVMLVSGDMSIGADGTLTHIDGDSVYAFGHRFLSVGATELPFARAEVLTLAPNLSTSFKISAAREFMGAITGDYSTAVTGQLGRRAATVPVALSVNDSAYALEMVRDRYLTPFLLQMAVYSAIDATERTIGAATVGLKGSIEFAGAPPIRLDDSYAGDFNIPMQVALATAIPLAYVLQGGFDDLRLERINLSLDVSDRKRQVQIEEVWPDRQQVRPGEQIELSVLLAGDNGAEFTRRVQYTVPPGAPDGALHFTVADAATTNAAEYGYLVSTKPRTPTQVITFLNDLRRNTGAYIRAWRPHTGYRVGGRNLPSPPASVALMLGRDSSALGGTSAAYRSRVAELSIDGEGAVITGSKTIQVEVKQ